MQWGLSNKWIKYESSHKNNYYFIAKKERKTYACVSLLPVCRFRARYLLDPVCFTQGVQLKGQWARFVLPDRSFAWTRE